MTNNDFDFIKLKFDESGVNAPEELNEDFVKDKIGNVEPLKVKKNKTKLIYGISAAAVIAVVLVNALLISGVFGVIKNGPESMFDIFKNSKSTNTTTAQIKSFSDLAAVSKELGRIIESNKVTDTRKYYALDDTLDYGDAEVYSADSGTSSGNSEIAGSNDSAASSHNSTYTQELGVDEADTIKTDGDYIYYLSYRSGDIEIYKADNGKLALVSSVNNSGYSTSAVDFYIYNNKLISLFDKYSNGSEITTVCIFDVSDKKKPVLADSFTQSGRYCSSRLIENKLYLVSSYYSYDKDCIPYCCGGSEATADEAKENTLDAGCIYSVENPAESSFMVVSCIDTDKPAENANTKAILGSAEEIYCNTENLYITAYDYESMYKDNMITKNFSDLIPYYYDYYEYTQIVKVSLNEELDFTASCKIEGRIDNQYSLDEYKGNLRVATTSINEQGKDTNNLFVLDKDLKELGKVTGFANNEHIEAVRYVNDTAYVITYEQTDPLFIIDLSNPNEPKITGEVKISGFSTMLVPVDDNTMLGIGYHTYDPMDSTIGMEVQGGLKIVTFDISDKNNPRVIDSKVFENCSSEVQYNPKALLVNFERGDYTIPLNYADYHYVDSYANYGEEYEAELHSGVLNFRVDNGKINIIDNYVSQKFGYDENNVAVDRCVYIGDYIYMFGSEQNYYYTIDYDAEYTENNSNATVTDSVKYK